MWSYSASGAFLSSYEQTLMINKRELNAKYSKNLFFVAYERATSYFVGKLFSSLGFKGFQTHIAFEIAKEIESGAGFSHVPVPDFGDMALKVSQGSNSFTDEIDFAMAIDPIAESIGVYEVVKSQGLRRWQMASPASIAITLLHLLLDEVLPKNETDRDCQWHIFIRPRNAILCEPVLQKYCDMRSVKVLHDASQMRDHSRESRLLMTVDLERGAFAVFKPRF